MASQIFGDMSYMSGLGQRSWVPLGRLYSTNRHTARHALLGPLQGDTNFGEPPMGSTVMPRPWQLVPEGERAFRPSFLRGLFFELFPGGLGSSYCCMV